jgi:hypothetical protein
VTSHHLSALLFILWTSQLPYQLMKECLLFVQK